MAIVIRFNTIIVRKSSIAAKYPGGLDAYRGLYLPKDANFYYEDRHLIAHTSMGAFAEIAVHQFQELIPVAGIEIVGLLPDALQSIIVFAAAIMGGTKSAKAAKALVDFLRTPETAAVIKAKGMEPAAP